MQVKYVDYAIRRGADGKEIRKLLNEDNGSLTEAYQDGFKALNENAKKYYALVNQKAKVVYTYDRNWQFSLSGPHENGLRDQYKYVSADGSPIWAADKYPILNLAAYLMSASCGSFADFYNKLNIGDAIEYFTKIGADTRFGFEWQISTIAELSKAKKIYGKFLPLYQAIFYHFFHSPKEGSDICLIKKMPNHQDTCGKYREEKDAKSHPYFNSVGSIIPWLLDPPEADAKALMNIMKWFFSAHLIGKNQNMQNAQNLQTNPDDEPDGPNSQKFQSKQLHNQEN
jgi:hypothetical protein